MQFVKFEPGVYCIYSQKGVPLYIGASTNLKARYNQHLYDLENNKHSNKYLQDYVNDYGINSIFYAVIFHCDESDLKLNEMKFINFIRPAFNIQFNNDLSISMQKDDLADKLRAKYKGQLVQFEKIYEYVKTDGHPDITRKRLGMKLKNVRKIRKRHDDNRTYYQF